MAGHERAGGTSALVVTLSTLAVAAAFQPLRLRQQVDLDALREGILEVVETTVQPRQATLWLLPSAQNRDAGAD